MLLSNGVNPTTNTTLIPADVLEMVTSGISVYPFVTDEYVRSPPSTPTPISLAYFFFQFPGIVGVDVRRWAV